jgi:uncharacterized protein
MRSVSETQRRTAVAILAGIGFALFPGIGSALDVPPLTGRIVDRAALLPPELSSSLSAELAAHEDRTGNQVVFLSIPSLEGESLEEYSHRVATTWKLGRKGLDNGVLVLVAHRDRKIRIEVGYGLEGTLTDAQAARIIRQEMVPRFRAADFPGGISAGLRAVMGTIEGTYTASEGAGENRDSAAGVVWEIVFLAVLVGIFAGAILGGQWAKPGGLIGSVIAFFTSLPAGWLLALIAAAIVLAVLLLKMAAGGRGRGRGDGVWSGPVWSGGGISDSGGFSGGGGDFGGGGASGQW